MARRIRKQVYLDRHNDEFLKRRATERGVTEAEIIREALDHEEVAGWERKRPPADAEAGWKLLAAIRALPTRQGRSRRRRSWTRGSLYKDRTGRWTRS